MKRLTLATSLVLVFLSVAAQGQSAARSNSTLRTSAGDDDASRAVQQLKHLQKSVIVYKSLGEFEENGKLANVSRETFETELAAVTPQLQDIIARMPTGKLKSQLTNALASYRDGAFWWAKIDQRRVISAASLAFEQKEVSPSDASFASTIPYTVAIHWRQAARYLAQAERNLARASN